MFKYIFNWYNYHITTNESCDSLKCPPFLIYNWIDRETKKIHSWMLNKCTFNPRTFLTWFEYYFPHKIWSAELGNTHDNVYDRKTITNHKRTPTHTHIHIQHTLQRQTHIVFRFWRICQFRISFFPNLTETKYHTK